MDRIQDAIASNDEIHVCISLFPIANLDFFAMTFSAVFEPKAAFCAGKTVCRGVILVSTESHYLHLSIIRCNSLLLSEDFHKKVL